MIIDFNRLRTFVTVAEIGSITKAASTLNLTQQAVSSQINLLEQDLGVLLFKRANRRIYLSKEGQKVLVSARERFKAIEQDIMAVVDDMSSMDTQLVIGTTNEIAEVLLADKIVCFKQRYPNVQFELVLNNDAKTEEGVLNGHLDLGIVVFYKEVKLLNVQPFRREKFITVASQNYLNKRAAPVISIRDILDHSIIDFEPHCPSLKTWVLKNDKKLISHFDNKRAAIAANDDRMIKRMVVSDMGIANLPNTLIQLELDSGLVVEILPKSKKIEAGIDIISMKQKTESLAAKAFVQFLLSPENMVDKTL